MLKERYMRYKTSFVLVTLDSTDLVRIHDKVPREIIAENSKKKSINICSTITGVVFATAPKRTSNGIPDVSLKNNKPIAKNVKRGET